VEAIGSDFAFVHLPTAFTLAIISDFRLDNIDLIEGFSHTPVSMLFVLSLEI
jgi:hypothetical protein